MANCNNWRAVAVTPPVCRYVKELEDTLAWMKGPDYKAGIRPRTHAKRTVHRPTPPSGATPPIKMNKPACLEAGSSSSSGGGDIVEMASQQVCAVSLLVAAVCFSFLTVGSLPLLLHRAMRLLVNLPSHTPVYNLISCFIYHAAELATLKTQLEVALERQSELEEENKVRGKRSLVVCCACVLHAIRS
jgi:hypothetical protein